MTAWIQESTPSKVPVRDEVLYRHPSSLSLRVICYLELYISILIHFKLFLFLFSAAGWCHCCPAADWGPGGIRLRPASPDPPGSGALSDSLWALHERCLSAAVCVWISNWMAKSHAFCAANLSLRPLCQCSMPRHVMTAVSIFSEVCTKCVSLERLGSNRDKFYRWLQILLNPQLQVQAYVRVSWIVLHWKREWTHGETKTLTLKGFH